MAAQRNAASLPDPATTLTATARGLVDELVRALEAAAGRPVKSADLDVASLSADEVNARIASTSAAYCVELGGALAGKAAVLFGGAALPGLSGLLSGAAEEELAARSGREVTDEDIEALAAPLAGALVGMAEKLAAYIGESPGLGLGDALLVRAGGAGELLKAVGSGPYPAACFALEVENLPAGQGMILFPRSFSAAPAAGAGGADAAGGSDPSGVAGGGDPALLDLHPNIRRVLRLKLEVSVAVAQKEMDFDAVLKLNPGTIIEFDKSADEALDLVVSGRKIGAGEVVIIGERFGVQLRHIEGLEQRIRKMGAAGR